MRRPPTPYPHEEIAALQINGMSERMTNKEASDRTGSVTPTQQMFDSGTSKHRILVCQPELNFNKNVPSGIHMSQTMGVRRLQIYIVRGGYPLVGRLQVSPKAISQLPVQTNHYVSVPLCTVDW